MRGRWDVIGGDLGHPGHRPDDHIELGSVVVELLLAQVDPSESGQMCHLSTGDGHGSAAPCLVGNLAIVEPGASRGLNPTLTPSEITKLPAHQRPDSPTGTENGHHG